MRTAYRGNFRTWVLDTRKRLDTYEKISNNYQSSKSDVYWIPRVSRPMYRQRRILCVISSIRLKVFDLVFLIFMFEQVAKILLEIKGKRLNWAVQFERPDMRFQWTSRQLWKIILISGDVWQTSQIYFLNPWTILNKIGIGVFLIFFSKFLGRALTNFHKEWQRL